MLPTKDEFIMDVVFGVLVELEGDPQPYKLDIPRITCEKAVVSLIANSLFIKEVQNNLI